VAVYATRGVRGVADAVTTENQPRREVGVDARVVEASGECCVVRMKRAGKSISAAAQTVQKMLTALKMVSIVLRSREPRARVAGLLQRRTGDGSRASTTSGWHVRVW